eukprot:GHVU01018104.1.p1 GENE.GHVU01018104.1~~GHVU01018104.1.p1  ORF type:complete len:815 (+),score=93.18 GHVU01018104.1:360-2804(+)
MANSQWKAPVQVQDPAILAFQRAPTSTTFSPVLQTPQIVQSSNHNAIRETGIVEKLLHSYGFIQCCDREARLFFHFSEYNGNPESMKIADPVEFQMSFDRRTGKPIAVSVIKIEQDISYEVKSEELMTGTVAQEPKGNSIIPGDGLGRVSYESNGECFFLPFGVDDIDTGASLKVGHKVLFYILTDKRNGNMRANKVQPLEPTRYQGVVCSMKDSFGFIERADVVKEIFFHYSEFKDNSTQLVLGDDVDFQIQIRNNKEVAVDIKRLPEGTVIFEDVGLENRRGRILNTLKSGNWKQSEPLAGRIVYETVEGSIEIPYGDKDQHGDYSLQPDDLVEFNIATDRRDKLQRATNIRLVIDTFRVNGEKRENGMVMTLKEGFGFIKCADRDARMFFHFSEVLEVDREMKQYDEVEFTVIQDPSSPARQIGIRIVHLPKGTVSFDTVGTERYTGTVEKEPMILKSPGKNREPDPGIIMYDVNNTKQTIPYSIRAVHGSAPKCGDKIEFQICESRRTNTKTAAGVKLLGAEQHRDRGDRNERIDRNLQQGFIAALKDNFGFIETAEHDREVFFHFSNFDGDASELELADMVEFSLARKTNKVSADYICKSNKNPASLEEVNPTVLDGKVIRCMRIINPDQDDYPGLVKIINEDENSECYPYGITSLVDKRDFLQKGDNVKFQVATTKSTGQKRATRIIAVRKFMQAKVDSVKGQFGFLNYTAEEGKKLFFHMTEVCDGLELQPGDLVEFVIVQNQRNGKYSACNIRKISEKRRPERLISRLKSVGDESGPRVLTLRQPRGPDNTKGFSQPRTLWTPPAN